VSSLSRADRDKELARLQGQAGELEHELARRSLELRRAQLEADEAALIGSDGEAA
jgi:hypothetical protein